MAVLLIVLAAFCVLICYAALVAGARADERDDRSHERHQNPWEKSC